MKVSGIYKIQSSLFPNKIYIGSAINIYRRWSQHFSDLKRNKHSNSKLQNHYNKYGVEDLQCSIILYGCKKDELIIIEQYFLDFYIPFFNICKIAGSNLGLHWKLSEESKANIAKASKGRKSALGYKHTMESKLKMSISKKHPLTEEHKKHQRKPKSELHKQHIKDSWILRKQNKK